MIYVFTELSDRYDFLLVVAGHGAKEYEDYLKSISSKLLSKDQIRFIGYIRKQKLLDYHNASDFFIATSKQEGIPCSVVEAFACGSLVICTKTGNTAELMKQYNCGLLLDIYDYKQWREKIEEILQGKLKVKPMDREIAKKHYDWSIISRKFINLYRELI